MPFQMLSSAAAGILSEIFDNEEAVASIIVAVITATNILYLTIYLSNRAKKQSTT